MYPPNPPTDGIYRVKLLSVEQDDAASYIRYDISVGPSVGWATYMYQQTGKWPLIWRLDKQKGTVAIRCALDALNRSAHANIQSLTESTGHHICLELQHRNYIGVKRSFPLSAYTIAPDDIRIGIEGGGVREGLTGCAHYSWPIFRACPYYTQTVMKVNLQWLIGVLSTILSYFPSTFPPAIILREKVKLS